MRGCFFVCNVFSIISLLLRVLAAQLLRFRLKICHRHIFQTPQQFSKSKALSIYFVFISLAQNAGLFFCLQCVVVYDYLVFQTALYFAGLFFM